MKEYTWEQAMEWWKESGDFEPLIRNAAVSLVTESNRNLGCPMQGVSSSDTNHEVYHMYGSYLNYLDYCSKNDKTPNMIDFLLDVTADCS